MLKHSKNYIFQQCFKQTPNWLSDICLHKIVNTCSSLMSFFLSFAYIFVFVNSLFVSTCSCLFTFEIKNHAYINVFKLYQILMLNLSAFCLKNVIFQNFYMSVRIVRKKNYIRFSEKFDLSEFYQSSKYAYVHVLWKVIKNLTVVLNTNFWVFLSQGQITEVLKKIKIKKWIKSLIKGL